MLNVLKTLYRSEAQQGYAAHATALALERAGLVIIDRYTIDRSPNNSYPHYLCRLTLRGKTVCETSSASH